MAQRINGNSLALYIGTDATRASTTTGAAGERIPIGNATSATLDVSNSVIDVTTKDSNSWREVISGRRSWTISTDGLLDNFGTTSTTHRDSDEINMYALAGTTIYLEFGVGDARFVGQGVISSLSQSGPSDAEATWSVTIEGSGELTWDMDVTS